jgi:stress-induced morphogen
MSPVLQRLVFISQKRAMSSAGGGAASQFPVTNAIRDKLTESFHPTHLEVINESHMHNV